MFNGGVEYNEETQWYETSFRQYDPAIGRFGAIDPLTHHIDGISPYQFAFNDPVFRNDPTGLAPSGGNVPLPHANYGGAESQRMSNPFGGGGFFDGLRRPFDVTARHEFTRQYQNVEIDFAALADRTHTFNFENGELSGYV
ncbi:MAG: RHS repeat-associated core domain-containing protein [Bacteroidota bacterium]